MSLVVVVGFVVVVVVVGFVVRAKNVNADCAIVSGVFRVERSQQTQIVYSHCVVMCELEVMYVRNGLRYSRHDGRVALRCVVPRRTATVL